MFKVFIAFLCIFCVKNEMISKQYILTKKKLMIKFDFIEIYILFIIKQYSRY